MSHPTTPADVLCAIAAATTPERAQQVIHDYGRAQYLEGYERGRAGGPKFDTTGDVMRVLEPRLVFSGPIGTGPLVEPVHVDAELHCVSADCEYTGTVLEFAPASEPTSMTCPTCGTVQARPIGCA